MVAFPLAPGQPTFTANIMIFVENNMILFVLLVLTGVFTCLTSSRVASCLWKALDDAHVLHRFDSVQHQETSEASITLSSALFP